MVQHCQNCQPSRGHLNGKYRFYGLLSQVSQVSKVPQISNTAVFPADEPHNHPNPPTLHQRTHTHDDETADSRNPAGKTAVLGRKFRFVPTRARGKGCAQGDASERRIERSSRAKTRQKALIALYGLRSTSGKRKSEFQGMIRAELSVPEPLELTA
jgi:hypothetical protein